MFIYKLIKKEIKILLCMVEKFSSCCFFNRFVNVLAVIQMSYGISAACGA